MRLLHDWLRNADINLEGGYWPNAGWSFTIDARVFNTGEPYEVQSFGLHLNGKGPTPRAALVDLCANLRGKTVITFAYLDKAHREFVVPELDVGEPGLEPHMGGML